MQDRELFTGQKLLLIDVEKKLDAIVTSEAEAGRFQDFLNPEAQAQNPEGSTMTGSDDRRSSPKLHDWIAKSARFLKGVELYFDALINLKTTRDHSRDLGFLLESLRRDHQILALKVDEIASLARLLFQKQESSDRTLLQSEIALRDLLEASAQHGNNIESVRLALRAVAVARRPTSPSITTPGDSASHNRGVMERLYASIEEAFRGSRPEIKRRQHFYLADVEAAVARTGANFTLDLACGRGEWLELLRDRNVNAIGVDTNHAQLEEARKAGLAVVQADALSFMKGEPSDRYAAISGFHIIEHLPFETLLEWLIEALRILRPEGVLLLETPNPSNLLVGASTFHLDPTHLKPIPAELLRTAVEAIGFSGTMVNFLHPHQGLGQALENSPAEIAYLLFGYQDYSLSALKPKVLGI